ncbi:MAG TPA: pilus assembly protein TadG-related protein [Dehalococcoidia bacterium]|nr:pilus assembly protein TadG-related protein [Dehalococcoidia bacterium]
MRTPARGAVRSSERGQVLVLFVVLFTVVLAFAAYAIDQGLWYGKRNLAQKSADLATRSAAIALFDDNEDPFDLAELVAEENGAEDIAVFGGDCPDGSTGVRVDVESPTRSLFSVFHGITGIEIGARSTACAGTTTAVDLIGDIQGISLLLRASDGGPRSCFSGGDLRLGRECVVYRSLNFNAPGNVERLIFRPGPDDCRGPGAPNNSSFDATVEFTCKVNTGGCGGGNPLRGIECVRTHNIGSVSAQRTVLGRIDARLGLGAACTSFQDSLGNADGFADNAPLPQAIPGGSSSVTDHVYVQNGCLNNPRVALVPIVANGNGGTAGVTGLAAVYITGCYDEASPLNESLPSGQRESETRTCDLPPGGFLGDIALSRMELRGIPIRLYMPAEAVGDLADIDEPNLPLTIQTVQ